MGRMAAFSALTHFQADTENRTGDVNAPVAEVATDVDYANPKTFTISPGETRSINAFVTNPRFDAFVVIPRTPGAVLVVSAVKDSPTSGTNLAPSGNDAMAINLVAQYPFESIIPTGDVLVDPTASTDYGLNPADNLPLNWEDGSAAVAGYWYRLLVYYPASVPDLVDFLTETASPAVKFRTQTGTIRFSTMLVQGEYS